MDLIVLRQKHLVVLAIANALVLALDLLHQVTECMAGCALETVPSCGQRIAHAARPRRGQQIHHHICR